MRRTRGAAVALVLLHACGGPGAQSTPEDAGPPGFDAASPAPDASADAGGADASIPPSSLAPCELRPCWLGTPTLSACGNATVTGDFMTGRYAVHRYLLPLRAGATVSATLAVTNGAWSPALLVLDPDGTTLYDGEHAATGLDVAVESIASGRLGPMASVRITTAVDASVHVYVTSWGVVDGDFATPPPTADATYELGIASSCPIGDAVCPVGDPTAITRFASGFYLSTASSDPMSPDYSPYKRDGRPEHHGYDIDVPNGTELVATQSGTIVEVSYDPELCGHGVNLSADSGVTFRYCHLTRADVTVGARVDVGQHLGLSGDTGNANYPHLHFGYLDGPDVRGSGLTGARDYRSELVNGYVDGLCR